MYAKPPLHMEVPPPPAHHPLHRSLGPSWEPLADRLAKSKVLSPATCPHAQPSRGHRAPARTASVSPEGLVPSGHSVGARLLCPRTLA